MPNLFPIYVLAVLATGTAFAAPADITVTLAQDGQPTATIVIAKEPTRSAQFAAYELQWHLKQVTGGDFLIVRDDQHVTGFTILVGDSQPVQALGIKTDAVEQARVPDPFHAHCVGAGRT